MTFAESVNRARSRCQETLLERIASKNAEAASVIVEPAPRMASGEVAFAPDGLKLPLRYDLVYQDSSGIYQNENAESISIEFKESVFATWEHKLKIEIHSLCWDYMQFHIYPIADSQTWEGLRTWFLHWFDLDDNQPLGSNGLYGVVHFISDPEVEDGIGRFFVDFGSASIDSLGKLFDEFIRMGAISCIIGSKQDAQQDAAANP